MVGPCISSPALQPSILNIVQPRESPHTGGGTGFENVGGVGGCGGAGVCGGLNVGSLQVGSLVSQASSGNLLNAALVSQMSAGNVPNVASLVSQVSSGNFSTVGLPFGNGGGCLPSAGALGAGIGGTRGGNINVCGPGLLQQNVNSGAFSVCNTTALQLPRSPFEPNDFPHGIGNLGSQLSSLATTLGSLQGFSLNSFTGQVQL